MKDSTYKILMVVTLLILLAISTPVWIWRVRQFQKVSGFGFWKAAIVLH